MRRLGIYILVAVALTNMALAHKAPAYDAKGNMVRDDRGYGYAYDFENRLTKVYTDTNANGQWDSGEPVHAEYAVDALGHRAGVTIGGTQTRRIYDRDDLVAEFVSSETPARIFVNGTAFPDEKVLMRDVAGTEHYFLLDQLGSVVGLANEQGGIVTSYAYDGYGMPVAGGREGDADADSDVDLRDYLTFQTQFGSSGTGAAIFSKALMPASGEAAWAALPTTAARNQITPLWPIPTLRPAAPSQTMA